MLGLSSEGVAAIAIAEHLNEDGLVATLRSRFPRAELLHDPEGTHEAIEKVIDFVEHPRENLDLPLDLRGTAFQRQVWAVVKKVPLGETTTFAEIARRVGAPRAVRAVGNACSRNPLEFAIPCHRVLRSNGSYAGGSAWGDRRQATLVRREAECSEPLVRRAGSREEPLDTP